jgi:hypothetical protein
MDTDETQIMKIQILQCNQCGKTILPQKHNGQTNAFKLVIPKKKMRPDGLTIALDRFGEMQIHEITADFCSAACLSKYVPTLQ